MKYAMLIWFTFSLFTKTECKKCSAGELKNGNGTCTPCPPGTFMPFTNHILSSCYDCEEKKANISVHHECNATHNTGCTIGRFQSEPYPQFCPQCTDCKVYEAKPCASESDAICCDYENVMILVKRVNDSVTCDYPSNHGQYCCEFQPQDTSTRDKQDTIMSTTMEKMQEGTTSKMQEGTTSKMQEGTTSKMQEGTTSKMQEGTISKMQEGTTSSADSHQSTDHYPINKTDPAYPQSGLEDGARIAVSLVIGVLYPVFGILSYFFFLKSVILFSDN